ncbi:hypothetical protein F5B17DRAFT_295625 [Nemania serpens]|nr:hypothetical protein F5B17DRAFT_295625 [Nemania serpens]
MTEEFLRKGMLEVFVLTLVAPMPSSCHHRWCRASFSFDIGYIGWPPEPTIGYCGSVCSYLCRCLLSFLRSCLPYI